MSNTTRMAVVAFGVAAVFVVALVVILVAASRSKEAKPTGPAAPAATRPVAATPTAPSPTAPSGEEGALLAGLGGVACALLLALVYLAVVVLAAAWMARDAHARRHEAAVWVLAFLLLHWLPLIVYLLARRRGGLVGCEHCGQPRLSYAVRCPHCEAATASA